MFLGKIRMGFIELYQWIKGQKNGLKNRYLFKQIKFSKIKYTKSNR